MWVCSSVYVAYEGASVSSLSGSGHSAQKNRLPPWIRPSCALSLPAVSNPSQHCSPVAGSVYVHGNGFCPRWTDTMCLCKVACFLNVSLHGGYSEQRYFSWPSWTAACLRSLVAVTNAFPQPSQSQT